MTTPICTNVGEIVEALRDTVIDFLFVWVCFVVGFADTFGDDFGVTFGVTRVLAVCALHSSRVFEEVTTERAAHNIVKLLLDKLVALLLVHFFFLLAHSALTIETNIEGTSSTGLFLETHGEMNPTSGFK